MTAQVKRDIYPQVVNIISPLDPSAGSTLGDLLPSPADSSTATAYVNTGGVFAASGNFTYYAGFGWYDSSNELANDFVVNPGSAIVVKSSSGSLASILPSAGL